MLEKLLQIVAAGGIHTSEDLATYLSISPPLLEAMLEELVRLGYLQEVRDGCGGQCTGCSIGRCSTISPGRLWALTDKGSRAAAQRSTTGTVCVCFINSKSQ